MYPYQTENISHNFISNYFTEILHIQGFSKDICRSMVAMLDFDKSGKLGYEEFKELWKRICIWKVN